MVTNSVIKKYTVVILLSFLSLPCTLLANIQSLRQEFLKTEKLIETGKIRSEDKINPRLKNYSLYPYLQLELLKDQVRDNPVDKISNFYNTYPDSPISKTLNYYWINYLAKQSRWSDIIKYYQLNTLTSLKCLYFTALENTTPEKITTNDIEELWLSGDSRPKECNFLFNKWISNNTINSDLIWKRIYQAIESNNIELVQALGKYLSNEENEDIKLWVRVNHNVNLINHVKLFDSSNDFHHKILIYSLKKIATKNIEQSLRNYRELNLRFQFNDEDKYDYYRFTTIRMFMQDHEKTEVLLNDIPIEFYNSQLHTVAIKSALKNANWFNVIKRIKQLPAEEQKEDIWIYWLARAYDETKQHNEAKKLYSLIYNKTNYYGLLACSNLKQPCPIEFAITSPYKSDKIKLLSNPGINRAIELYKLKRYTLARLEWNSVIKNLDEKQQYIAGNIASELNWHDRNIINFGKPEYSTTSQDKPNAFLHLKYPLGYQESILKFAKKYNLDPAWVFAISRQESAFIVDAKSRAGALGLMQLMPTTAKKLAKANKIPYSNQNSLLNETTNIRLGSVYLQKMLENNKGNAVLATAAYNAGPTRVKKWLKDSKPIATDIWIELVPFYETRDYIKRVLTNTAIYRSRLGKTPTILGELIPVTIDSNNISSGG